MNNPQRRGFTLIELLVVIAIIAILAAILFPVFSKAREKARQTQCTNNQRQIALGILMYAQEHEETMPDAASIWRDIKLTAQPTVTATALLQGTTSTAFKCPNSTKANGYGYNNKLSGISLGDNTIIDPTGALLTADSGNAYNVIFALDGIEGTRHAASFIASCLDGHTEMILDTAKATRFGSGTSNPNPGLAFDIATPAAIDAIAKSYGKGTIDFMGAGAVAWSVNADNAGVDSGMAASGSEVSGIPGTNSFSANITFTDASVGKSYWIKSGTISKKVTIVNFGITVLTTPVVAGTPAQIQVRNNGVDVAAGAITWVFTPIGVTAPAAGSSPFNITFPTPVSYHVKVTETASGLSAESDILVAAPPASLTLVGTLRQMTDMVITGAVDSKYWGSKDYSLSAGGYITTTSNTFFTGGPESNQDAPNLKFAGNAAYSYYSGNTNLFTCKVKAKKDIVQTLTLYVVYLDSGNNASGKGSVAATLDTAGSTNIKTLPTTTYPIYINASSKKATFAVTLSFVGNDDTDILTVNLGQQTSGGWWGPRGAILTSP